MIRVDHIERFLKVYLPLKAAFVYPLPKCFLVIYVLFVWSVNHCKKNKSPIRYFCFPSDMLSFCFVFFSIVGEGLVINPSTIHLPHFFSFFFQSIYMYRTTKHLTYSWLAVMTISLHAVNNMVKSKPQTKPSWKHGKSSKGKNMTIKHLAIEVWPMMAFVFGLSKVWRSCYKHTRMEEGQFCPLHLLCT